MEKDPKIKIPDVFKVTKKIQKKLDLFTDKISKSKLIQWIGSSMIERLFYLYLFNKYKTK